MLYNVLKRFDISILPPESGLSFVWYHFPWAQSVFSTPWSYNPAQTWTFPIPGSSFSSHKFSFPEDSKKLKMLAHFINMYFIISTFSWVHLIRSKSATNLLCLGWCHLSPQSPYGVPEYLSSSSPSHHSV